MSYVSIDQSQQYTGVFDNPEKMQSFIDASEAIVQNYLGYQLELKKYLTIVDGNNRQDIQLEARPIKEILRVVVNDVEIPVSQFEAINEYIHFTNTGIFPSGRRNIKIVYNAGFDNNVFNSENNYYDGGDANNNTDDFIGNADANTVSPVLNAGNALLQDDTNKTPSEIILTILRIAALLESESNQNIGVTSKSFGDSGSRTFVNYTSFQKYLFPISHYRLKRI